MLLPSDLDEFMVPRREADGLRNERLPSTKVFGERSCKTSFDAGVRPIDLDEEGVRTSSTKVREIYGDVAMKGLSGDLLKKLPSFVISDTKRDGLEESICCIICLQILNRFWLICKILLPLLCSLHQTRWFSVDSLVPVQISACHLA
ncbi:hypothetical protein KSP40_PGU013008 [Platanthera guangdongensis]|uniref:Uncharacterized protein n=1 Tax=Platanthera guangdongensis TaxID=2320717 RepID=A0ABR2LRH2_9ASPA